MSEPAVGLEPTSSALRERCPACRAAPAIVQGGRWESDPQLSGSQPDPRSTWVRPQYPWQESNLHEPPPSQGGVPPPHSRDISSTPTRTRTWTSTFGGSHDVRFTTRAQSCGGWI